MSGIEWTCSLCEQQVPERHFDTDERMCIDCMETMYLEEKKRPVFFAADWQGKARGGYYVRSDLFKHIDKLEETGVKVVGIEVNDEWNLHLITEVTESKVLN